MADDHHDPHEELTAAFADRYGIEDCDDALDATFERSQDRVYDLLAMLLARLDDLDTVEGVTRSPWRGLRADADEVREVLRHNAAILFFALSDAGTGRPTDSGQFPVEPMSLLTTVNEMDEAIRSFRDRVRGADRRGPTHDLDGWAASVSHLVHSLTNTLWTLLKTLLKPESWTLSGELGQAVLGLQGVVAVDVSFT